MTRFPGLGSRFADRLHALGFWKDDRPDVGRFCREKGYRPQYVYAWLKDRMPGYDNIRRLCLDLDVSMVWFVAGDEALTTTNGRSAGRNHVPASHRRRRAATPRAASLLDLAPLRDATDRITSLQAEFETLFAAFPDPCLWIDETGTILDVKGLRDAAIPSDVAGRALRDAFAPETAATLQKGIARALRANGIATVECRVGSDRARARTYEARIRPVMARSRGPRKVLVVLRDVTERQARESEHRASSKRIAAITGTRPS